MDFSGNDMSDTPSDLLQGLDWLETLSMNCSLTAVPLLNRRTGFRNLEGISLSHNKISELGDPATFADVVSLGRQELSRNYSDNLHEDIIKLFTRLEVNLHNKIKKVQKLFQNKWSLKSIYLSKNLIEYMPVSPFLGIEQTKHLHLTDNRLTFNWQTT